jgi:hypothetical protein
MVVAEFGTGQVFLSMLYFFLFVAWIWMLVAVLGDVLRSPDLPGWGKALWAFLVIALPLLGVLAYLIARGGSMSEHAMAQAARREEIYGDYVGYTVSSQPGDSRLAGRDR